MNKTDDENKNLFSKASNTINRMVEDFLNNKYTSATISFFRFLFGEINRNELAIRAMSMVYITLLSLVPILALSFSILKAFGVVQNKFQPLLIQFLSPLGEKGVEVSNTILEFIDRTNFGVLGIIGLLVLLYTVFSLINKIEGSLNKIWRVGQGRSIARRFSDYISITLVGPVIMFAAIGLTASLASNTIIQKLISYELIGSLIILWGKILPSLIVSLFFTFIYKIVPNTDVKMRYALIGGVIAGISWQLAGWVLAYFVKISTKKVEIYSSLAILIFFMMWIYINWLIVLTGAQISYCLQNLKSYRLKQLAVNLGNELIEKLSFTIMYLVGKSYLNGEENWTANRFVKKLQIPFDTINDCMAKLVENRILVEIDTDEKEYLPARSLESISLKEIFDSTRKSYDNETIKQNLEVIPEVNKVSRDIEETLGSRLESKSLRDILN